jgi:hypothetical protein
MTHYPSHKRDAFLALVDTWIGEGHYPDLATLEVDYEPVRVPAIDFLEDFVGCTDVLPAEHQEKIVEITERAGARFEKDEPLTYARAAQVLLMYMPPRLEIADAMANVYHALVSLPDPEHPGQVGTRVGGVELTIFLGQHMRMIEAWNVRSVVTEGVGQTRLTPEEAREIGEELIRIADEAEAWNTEEAEEAAA